MAENTDNTNESTELELPLVSMLQGSRLTGGGNIGFGSPVLRAGILRPSLLGPSRLGLSSRGATNISNNSNVSFTNDANDDNEPEAAGCNDGAGDGPAETVEATSNPFLKHPSQDEPTVSENAEAQSEVSYESSTEHNDSDERLDPLTMLRNNGIERANMFAATKTSTPLVEATDFVFGQNMHERAVGETVKSDNTATISKEKKSASVSGYNLATATEDPDVELKSLTDVARKRKYEEVKTVTGEENEVNIVDLKCKLFALVNSNWEERGRGSLRLNDSKIENECSSLVFRSAVNLRLLIISKVWAGMVAERQNLKTLRITAMDSSEKIKIYLVKARPAEINELHSQLIERIDKRKNSHPDELGAAGGVDGSDNAIDADNVIDIANESDANESDTASVGEPEVEQKSAIQRKMNKITEI